MKQFFFTLSLLLTLSSQANEALKSSMQAMGKELKTIGTKLAQGQIDDSAIESGEALRLAILKATSELPDLIADQTLIENQNLKLKYSGLMFKLYGTSFELEYHLTTGDLASAQASLTQLTDLRKLGHQFFKPAN